MTIRSDPRQRCPKDIPILMYHHLEFEHPARTAYAISVRRFEDQLNLLQRAGFTTVNFRQLLEALGGGRPLPRKPVLITFDDGYVSFLDHALPALQARRMTATTFLVAGQIGGFNCWDDEKGIPRRPLMNQTAVEEVIAAGFEIGSHGWAHRDLLVCSREELEEEIGRSRQALQTRFGIAAAIFAYPYGRHSEAHYDALADAGFEAAVTFASSTPTVTSERFAMRRVYVHQGDTLLRFFLKLSPWYLRYKAWRGAAAGH